jgi:hypothetical protein
VIACRVTLDPLVSCEMENRCPFLSRASSDNLVWSPKAAKTMACFCSLMADGLGLLRDIRLYVLQLLCPSALVFAERFKAAVSRNFIETGFGKC